MSDLLGPQQLGQKQGEVFLGRDYGHQANYSDEVAARIDGEIRSLIDEAHMEARAVLDLHRATLDQLAAALVEKETLDTAELTVILGPLAPWAGRHAMNGAKANGNGRAPATAATAAGTGRVRRARATPPKG